MAEVTPSRVRNQDRELVICALYSGGETLEEIASRFPSSHGGTLSKERIRQIVTRNGVTRPGNRSADPLKVLGLVAECRSVRAIAKRLGAPDHAVARVLDALAPGVIQEMEAYRHEAMRNRLLAELTDLAVKLGRTPLKKDHDRFGPPQGSLQRVFGSMTNARRLAGLPSYNRGHPHMTPAQRAEIALRYVPGREGNSRALAKEYGVDQAYIPTIAKSFRKLAA